MRWRLLCCLLCIASSAQALTLRLEWGAPTTGVPEGYVMYRQPGGVGPFEVLATIPVPITTYTDETATVGVQCYYVTAYAGEEESVPSNTACFSDMEERPGPPVALRLAP